MFTVDNSNKNLLQEYSKATLILFLTRMMNYSISRNLNNKFYSSIAFVSSKP